MLGESSDDRGGEDEPREVATSRSEEHRRTRRTAGEDRQAGYALEDVQAEGRRGETPERDRDDEHGVRLQRDRDERERDRGLRRKRDEDRGTAEHRHAPRGGPGCERLRHGEGS